MKRFIISSALIRHNAVEAVKAIRGDDKLEVIIKPHIDDQTDAQRSFFHVLNGIMAKEFGCSPDANKMDLKRETWGSTIEVVRGVKVEVVKSSTKAKKDEYSELIETAYRVAAQMGCILPDARGYHG